MFEPTVHLTPRVGPRRNEWWRGAVIYQIYPRSFAIPEGGSTGDLPSILPKLDHIASLGVDAIWISPFMKSPMRDFGYDVADYCAVDPMFGSIEDFDRLIERCRALGLEVLIDFVPSHTSNEHPWFLESRESRNGPKADWYVWADPKADGSPPNNWLAVFGGSAWAWEPRRGQYYLHNFLVEQPDLNFHNPEVIAALLDQARFWLDRGVSGFRVDAIDFGVHDRLFRDNPPRLSRVPNGGASGSPFDMQIQLYNKARPELSDLFLKPLYRLTERYEGRALLGEISGDRSLERVAEYSDGGGLDMSYTFDLLSADGPKAIANVVCALERHVGEGWPCWSLSNHDVERAVTRFGGRDAPEGLRVLLPQLLACLRGTICLYQGEELGLEEAEIAYEQLQDPFGKAFWPSFKGRDGARTPMPWSDLDPADGSWLPTPPSHRARSVARQNADPESALSRLSRFFAWRKGIETLRRGSFELLWADDRSIGFARSWKDDTIWCAFNFSDQTIEVELPGRARILDCPTQIGDVRRNEARLPPFATFYATPAP